MFSRQLVESDRFSDMAPTARLLYFYLGLAADDDGFVDGARRIQRSMGASEDDLKVLIAKGYLILFDDGVCALTRWHLDNFIRKDRYHETEHQDDLALLSVEDGLYRLKEQVCPPAKISTGQPNDNHLTTIGQPLVNQNPTEVRLGKVRLGKVRLDKDREKIYCPNQESENSGQEAKRREIRNQVVAYLNSQTGSHFRASSDKTRRCIDARINEGYTLDDFRSVVDHKVCDWLSDPEMSKYLRPETLFGPKFEGYLNQQNVIKLGRDGHPLPQRSADPIPF
jgi:uncharacterized phage protein (TIGR02220 family)